MPPELLNNDPDGFAWGVWHDRTPKLVGQVKDAHPYGSAQRRALDGLLDEIAGGLIAPLGAGPGEAVDQATWAAWGTDYFGTPWLDAPFLGSESYFYRRLLDAVGFFGPGAWQGIDPFAFLKEAELRDPALESDLAALDALGGRLVPEQGQIKLLASLWGNQADLGYLIDKSAGPGLGGSAGSGSGGSGSAGLGPGGPGSAGSGSGGSAGPSATEPAGLVADDSAAFWAALGPGADVILVADNAGRELLADLVLIDHLLRHGQAASVALHVKPSPYYVSDATTADVLACLRRLTATPGSTHSGSAAQIAARLTAALRAGQLTLDTHDFYCAPWSYHRLPADLAACYRRASLTILKGDLNYRRLTGDRAWPATTPLTSVTAYFPGRVAALRTLKSDVVTGLDPAVVARLDATRQPWRTNGQHGLIQVRPS
jgi:Damage-control phosphatase ARMT1-like domain